MLRKRIYQSLGLVTLLVFLLVLPFTLSFAQQDFMIFLLINVLVVISYRLIALTGEWSLAHVVLMGVGAYSSTLLAKLAGLSFWICMPLAGIITALIAFILSFPLFRMSGMYFLIGSFAAGEAIRLTWNYFQYPFGGSRGISNIPSPEITLPGLGTFDFFEPIPYYFLTLVIVTFCFLILYRLEHSQIGMTFHSIHWRDALAESVGVNTWQYRTLAHVIASFFVGIAGSLLTHYLGSINPHQFSVSIMVYVLIWVIVGGTKTIAGPIIGVTVLSLFNEWLRFAGEFRPLIYGCVLIACIMFMPDGLEGVPAKIRRAIKRLRGKEQEEIEETADGVA